ncbi:acyl-CoA-binding protein [Mesonia sediminis]|uniref:Acyl-CoA-binding protein n=1 Tax=Mesonia sediminis TaxID=1703946 RepID=A0ABW5SDF9_9FLAO
MTQKMSQEELDKSFKEAYNKARKTKLRFPPDLMLEFYAYYKKATSGSKRFNHKDEHQEKLITAFKMNALFQVENLEPNQAKLKYIEMVNKYIPH